MQTKIPVHPNQPQKHKTKQRNTIGHKKKRARFSP